MDERCDNSINNTIQFDPAIISRLSFQHCPIKIRVSRFRDNDFTRPFHRRFLPSPREVGASIERAIADRLVCRVAQF